MLHTCERRQSHRHGSDLLGYTLISLMRFWGYVSNRFIIAAWQGGVSRNGFTGHCLEGDTHSAALQQELKY